ncbi:CAP domain-containing protein [Dokdonia sp. Asnod1-B02]|uniref:CAP domain-containing protein n=1 Tax=Dokdonia sp. Asnod1-B02 TaxID=3160573 RepID=UPI0030ECE021|tara:strand:+ start:36363 stop:36851 length:489 start_codon:yes stop_codon:yes gene_type:complete
MRILNVLLVLVVLTASCKKKKKSNTTTSPPITSTSNRPSDSAREAAILQLVNDYRDSLGIRTLRTTTLSQAQALDHTNYMVDKRLMSHDNFFKRSDYLKYKGATAVSENVGKGYRTAQGVVNGWLNSPKHKAAIESDATHTSIASIQDANGIWYDTQLFLDF